ncbi:myosin-7-like [Trachinotus anak]|uniref:myosin-7-like n=1 Tax=Trachinotus anak TaxID=443729 RepID=UPI0039F16FFE
MAWAVSSRSVGQKHLELRKLVQAVIGPLKSGLQSFNNVSEMLLRINTDIVYPGCQTFHDVRLQIMNMKKQMEKSEQIAREELQHLDEETERLTAEQSNLAEQKKKKECELNDLKTQLDSHRSSLKSYRDALKTERRNLSSAEDTLSNMRQRRDNAETVRNVGIGLMFIPIVGWIPGAAMAIVGEVEMDQASDAVDRAKQEIESCESQVRSYSNKVSDYKSLIHQAKHDIRKVDKKISQTQAKLWDMSVKRRDVADVQDKMRRAVHQLGLLYGRGRAAELHTRQMIQLGPVVKVMEEMTAALGNITGDELLHTEGIKSLMWDMRMNHNKLKELADTKKSLDDGYY